MRTVLRGIAGRRLTTAVLLAGAWSLTAAAQAPDAVLLLVNSESEASLRVGRVYAGGRGIPESHRIALAIPRRCLEPVAEMTAAEFESLIWEPALRILVERGLEDRIQAWVYSVDFPLRIRGEPPLSLTGLTFLRNRWPDPAEAREGRYRSPLYGGPEPGDGSIRPPRNLKGLLAATGPEAMPLPAAMLGYLGPGGNSMDTLLGTLRASIEADATRPRGTVYLLTGDDVRGRIRQWHFEAAAAELSRYGVRAVVTSDFPAGRDDVFGIMAGSPDPSPESVGRYLPGAFAEHLTSFSAVFDIADQTKATDWIAAGAAASAGVVTEPRAYWTKFPTARFFVYYAAGGTLLESFVQSVRSPLQAVLFGDPLMRPFGTPNVLPATSVAGKDIP